MKFDEYFTKIESGTYNVFDKMGAMALRQKPGLGAASPLFRFTETFGKDKIYTLYTLKSGTPGPCVFRKTGLEPSPGKNSVSAVLTLPLCKKACDTNGARCAAWQFSVGGDYACNLFNTGSLEMKGRGWP